LRAVNGLVPAGAGVDSISVYGGIFGIISFGAYRRKLAPFFCDVLFHLRHYPIVVSIYSAFLGCSCRPAAANGFIEAPYILQAAKDSSCESRMVFADLQYVGGVAEFDQSVLDAFHYLAY